MPPSSRLFDTHSVRAIIRSRRPEKATAGALPQFRHSVIRIYGTRNGSVIVCACPKQLAYGLSSMVEAPVLQVVKTQRQLRGRVFGMEFAVT